MLIRFLNRAWINGADAITNSDLCFSKSTIPRASSLIFYFTVEIEIIFSLFREINEAIRDSSTITNSARNRNFLEGWTKKKPQSRIRRCILAKSSSVRESYRGPRENFRHSSNGYGRDEWNECRTLSNYDGIFTFSGKAANLHFRFGTRISPPFAILVTK